MSEEKIKPWNPRLVQRELVIGLAQLYPDATVTQISRVHSVWVSRQTVDNACRRAGVRVNRGKPHWLKSVDWDAQGLGVHSDQEIARRLGCHASTVRDRRRERGIPVSPDVLGGRRVPVKPRSEFPRNIVTNRSI